MAVLQKEHQIDHIDVVVAMAGISKYYEVAAKTAISEVRDHFEVNSVGPLLLFQATLPLLEKSAHPVFVGISTGIASIGDMHTMPMPVTAYGMSKVALNYLVQKIHLENPSLVAFVLSPGYVGL